MNNILLSDPPPWAQEDQDDFTSVEDCRINIDHHQKHSLPSNSDLCYIVVTCCPATDWLFWVNLILD